MQLAPHPEIPPLPAQTAAACPEAPQLPDGKLATLTRADAALAILYASCAAKHAAAVAAYNLARDKINGAGTPKPPGRGGP